MNRREEREIKAWRKQERERAIKDETMIKSIFNGQKPVMVYCINSSKRSVSQQIQLTIRNALYLSQRAWKDMQHAVGRMRKTAKDFCLKYVSLVIR